MALAMAKRLGFLAVGALVWQGLLDQPKPGHAQALASPTQNQPAQNQPGQNQPAQIPPLPAPQGPPVLTITGDITTTNVGDSLQLDAALLARLPQTSFSTSTIWTTGIVRFQGVLLRDVLAAAGAKGQVITMTAINDYQISMPVDEIGADAPMLAYLEDGKPISLRDKGPVWVVYPYDSNPGYRSEMAYSRSVWQMDHINVGN